jgi:hypothetical protein
MEQIAQDSGAVPYVAPDAWHIIDRLASAERHACHVVVVTQAGVLCSMLGSGMSLQLVEPMANQASYEGRAYICNLKTGSNGVYNIIDLLSH